jgi:DNA-binding winged helix-turn-helix (wHTH) protein/tetratricopeptide (TPR) repeat protein
MRYIFGDYVLDTQRHELHHAGEPVPLRRKVFQVLVYLLEHRDRVISRQEFLEQLWPNQFIGDAALTSCLKIRRRVLGEQGRTPRYLRTLHGQGYRFVAAVEEREHLPADTAALAPLLPGDEDATRQVEMSSSILTPVHADLGSAPLEAPVGEYKQVTALCGALAEAPILATRLGPETMYHLMREVLTLARETVQRYDGTLLYISGEGFLALFGAPVAQEDHARRAVLAALDLRQRVHALEVLRGQPFGVALRLGLHSGPAVVGTLADAPQRPYAAGVTLHTATQLQQQAAPDTLLMSATTHALVQDEVQGEVCEIFTGDALSPAVPVYAIHGLKQRRAGVPRHRARPLSRFVGRAQELVLLHARLAQAVGGHGQVIGIAGEPGLGKSRLLVEFAHRLHGQAVTYCEGHCLPYSSATPYLPVRDLLQKLWGLSDSIPASSITATVQQRLCEAGVTSEAETLLLLQLLDMPVDLAPVAALSPPERKARTFALLRHLFWHASQQQPLVLALENLHWVDPTSEEWLISLVERLEDTSMLLLATYRSGYQPPWLRHSAATQMSLPRLSLHDSLTVLQSVPQAAQLPVPLQQAIVARAAGSPFFVEELTWAAVAHGDPACTLLIPETIEAVLAARLDQLPPEEKHLVQTAAVIGTEVPVPLLQRIVGLPEEALQQGLGHLQSLEFLYETHLFPEHAYTFKHALTREVAYNSLLHERRHALHAQIVEILETLAGDRVAEQVEHLAYHALRGAFRVAVAFYEQALQALAYLPENGDTSVLAIEIRLALTNTLRGEHRRGRTLLGEAETLARALNDRGRLGWVLAELAQARLVTGDLNGAVAAGQQALDLAVALGDHALQCQASHRLGQACHAIGALGRAAELLRWSVAAMGREAGTSSLAARIDARSLLVLTLSDLGAFVEGRRYGEETLHLATREGRGPALASIRSRLGRLYFAQGDLASAIRVLEQGVTLCRASDDWDLLRPTVASLGYTYVLQGRLTEGRALLEEGIQESIRRGEAGNLACFVAWLSEVCRLAGRSDEAWQHARQALDLARQLKERGNEAYVLHQLGVVQAHADPPEVAQAEAHYHQALVLAEALGMRPLQAHCHRGLGTLYAETGKQEPARTALSTALALYRAMDMAFWLPQTAATLAQVG